MNNINQMRIFAKKLHLANIANMPIDTSTHDLSYHDFLFDCLKNECQYREDKAKLRRIKQAQLPAHKDFESFDTAFQKGISEQQLTKLSEFDWIDNLYNLILLGLLAPVKHISPSLLRTKRWSLDTEFSFALWIL